MDREEAIKKAKDWVNNSFYDSESRREIQELLDKNDINEITDRFYKDLDFGTGGIRSIIGQGINRMNKYTVMKATQALADELKSLDKRQLKVAISYDSRRFSPEFAKITASVLAGNGITALIYQRLNPVCLLSFSVRYHKADAGVMITASHNPPEYNGYKVYWSDGAQVIPPTDKSIIEKYSAIHDFSSIPLMDFEEGRSKGLIRWIGEDIENKYLEMIKERAINPQLCREKGKEIKLVYSPIHGSGMIPCTRALGDLGMTNYLVVESQAEPNGDFPTVKYPNPEDPEAMKLAVDLMMENGAELALASDPDADRLGVAVNHKGKAHFLTGNQIGSLMLYYVLRNLSEKGETPENPYVVKSIVTTSLQETIANHYEVKVENTLTGFKWICGRVKWIEENQPERTFVFGTEESFGYLNHDQVRDKDGVSSISLLGEMALWFKQQKMTLIDALEEIFEKFGFSHEAVLSLTYQGKEGTEKIARIMEYFRNYKGDSLCGEKILFFEDYQSGTRIELSSGKETDIELPASNVLGLEFDSSMKLFLRPSGTEPKIKFYLLIRENEGSIEERRKRAKEKGDKFISYLKEQSGKV